MRLLIVTQKMDRADSTLGFFHRWVEEFALHAEFVTVICLEEGEHALPKNVRVYSLGKEKGRRSPLGYAVSFLSRIVSLRAEYDSVFVHMNPEYLLVAGPLWRLWGKKIGLWYVHKKVSWRLRAACLFVHRIFTASSESFRMRDSRVRILGHGIDTTRFALHPRAVSPALSIISAGRISPSKRVEVVLVALGLLRERGIAFSAKIVGAAGRKEEEEYAWNVRTAASVGSDVTFTGAVPYEEMPGLLSQAQYFLSASTTGSLDKAVLEAASAGVVPITSNEAFRDMLEPLGLFVREGTPEEFAAILAGFAKEPGRAIIAGQALSKMVHERHALSRLVPAILAEYQGIMGARV